MLLLSKEVVWIGEDKIESGVSCDEEREEAVEFREAREAGVVLVKTDEVGVWGDENFNEDGVVGGDCKTTGTEGGIEAGTDRGEGGIEGKLK